MTPVIETKGLSFSYHREQLLRAVDLAVMPGEFVAVAGENGVGKSTLLRLILGELEPDSGSALLMGKPAGQFRGRPPVGYVPQNGMSLAEGFPATAAEVVAQGLYAGVGKWRRPGERKRLVREALTMVELERQGDRLIGRLSGGQMQRVLIARALAGSSRLLVLDEPTSGVDSETALSLYGLLQTLAGQGELAVLMVTHDTARVGAYASRTLRLSGGGLTEEKGS